jgi:hypothetical protein
MALFQPRFNEWASVCPAQVPTYDVVAVNQALGLVEFVASTVPIKALILKPSLIPEEVRFPFELLNCELFDQLEEPMW